MRYITLKYLGKDFDYKIDFFHSHDILYTMKKEKFLSIIYVGIE